MAVGIKYSEVESIQKKIKSEKKALATNIESVGTISKTIATSFSGKAGKAFQDTMKDYVTKAKEAIEVYKEIDNYLKDIAKDYKDYDTKLESYFTISK